MLSILEKFKEAIFSVLPIFLVVLLFSFTITPLSTPIIVKFVVGSLFMILGMPLFLLGIDISITPIGEQISEVLVKTNKFWFILLGGGFLGFVVTVAEPDLHILGGQVSAVTNGVFNSKIMILVVSLGVGLMVSFGIFRIVKNVRLNRFMLVVYVIILLLGVFTLPDFLAIAFDASGSTTGAISVPLILALAAGISTMTRSNEKEENDGFGMLGIASTGAIIAIMLQGILTGAESLDGTLPVTEIIQGGIWSEFLKGMLDSARDILVTLLPIILIFFIVDFLWIKLSMNKRKRILIGCIYTYVGLIIFLTGVNTGFMEASSQVGYQLATLEKPWLLVVVGMVFGVITIPAEPSVHILTHQIEEETAGSIKAITVMLTLCIGVAIAVGLSMLRIIFPTLQLWHILLPGMVIAILLSFLVPDIFVGIAYDSGGVAAGTMTAAFILPYAQGISDYFSSSNIIQDAFGVIAIVAMTPLVALQLLGLVYKLKTRHVLSEVSDIEDDGFDLSNDEEDISMHKDTDINRGLDQENSSDKDDSHIEEETEEI